ncbi:MAG: SDR family oxidoreductase [Microbacteriaceae bacterium]|nr:SDR family oxidoreductase [Microbacteriaceae bacterium]
MTRLDGMTAIVTGAGASGQGIGNGRGSAIRLAEEGARVALLDVTDSVFETRDMIVERGGECLVIECDVTDSASAERAVGEVVSSWGRLDVLVNNVGIGGPTGTVVDVDLDAWTACFAINVTSMVVMSRFALPAMIASGGGSIVNMSSVAGLRGGHAAIAYATTKGAVVNLTKAMAVHHGHEGVRVNAVAPGLVYTPMVATRGIEGELRAQRASSNLLGTEGTGWDVAEAVLYLASPASRWVTGTVLTVDGGIDAVVPAMQNSITSGGATRGR